MTKRQGKVLGKLDTKEVDKKVEESVNRARPSPCLDAKLSTRPRWYWEGRVVFLTSSVCFQLVSYEDERGEGLLGWE